MEYCELVASRKHFLIGARKNSNEISCFCDGTLLELGGGGGEMNCPSICRPKLLKGI